MAAFFLGLTAPNGGDGLAMTLAFAALTQARLFHGFTCRGDRSLVKLGLLTNPAELGAFAAGTALLMSVLSIPPLRALFQVSSFTPAQFGWTLLLAFLPTLIIQIVRTCRDFLQIRR